LSFLIIIAIAAIAIAFLLMIKWRKIANADSKNNDAESTRSEQNLKLNIQAEVLPQVITSEQETVNEKVEDQYIDNYWIPVESKRRKVSARLMLKYRNTKNIISERAFDVEAFSRGDKGYHIHGYCQKKHRNIALSSLGIMEAIDNETGEVIENINSYLEQKYKDSSEQKKDLLFDEYGWAVYSLVYLAGTSGSIVKKERDIITAFIRSIPRFSCLEDEWIDKTIRELYRPGKMEIRNWVKAAIDRGADFTLIMDSVGRLSELQKEENKEFISFRRYIENQMEVRNPKETKQGNPVDAE
jgi:hypothetical protein